MSDQLYRGQAFALGDQVTAQKLMDLVNKATIQTGAITSQPALASKTIASDDNMLSYDASSDTLVKIKAEDVLQSNLPIEAVSVKTNTINGVTGADTVITPAASQKVSIVGNAQVSGTFTPTSINPTTESFGFTGPKALTIPSGNTAGRPVVPVLGDMRWNTEIQRSEIYDGTVWKELGTPPFDASGGDVVLAPEATTTAALFSSDGSIVTVTNASGHSVNEGQIVEIKSSTAGYVQFEGVAYDITTYTFKVSIKPNASAVVSNITCTYRKSGRHKIHIFKNSGILTVGNQDTVAEVTVVGGGGGGAVTSNFWLGGSAGGVAFVPNLKIEKNQTYSIVIGIGGVAGALGGSSTGGNGGHSSAFNISAYGGEGSGFAGTNYVGASGGNNIGETGISQTPSSGNVKGFGWSLVSSMYSLEGIENLFYQLRATNHPLYICRGGNKSTTAVVPNYGDGGSVKITSPRSAYNGGSGVVIIKYPYWINV